MMSQTNKIQGGSPEIGRCIYCDSTDSLTREHVVPEGIGGRQAPISHHRALVLLNATCEACRKKTQAIEDECQRKMMGQFRAWAGMVRKDRAKDTLKIKFTDHKGNEYFEEVSLDQIPPVIMQPAFFDPGITTCQPIGSPYNIRIYIARADGNPIVSAEGGVPEPYRRFVAAGLGPAVFAQMLAKIGLCMAVYHFGIDGFKPLVRDFIRGEINEFGHWVGGPAAYTPENPSKHLHEFHITILEMEAGIRYVAVYIRLFAIIGGPRNYVIVGTL